MVRIANDYRKLTDMLFIDPIIGPDHCAQSIVDDYKVSSQYTSILSKAIAEQLSEYRASISEETPQVSEPESGRLKEEEEDATWWEGWRKRLRTEKGYVKIGKDKDESKRKRKMISTDTPMDIVKKEEPDVVDADVDLNPILDEKSDHELRVIRKVSLFQFQGIWAKERSA